MAISRPCRMMSATADEHACLLFTRGIKATSQRSACAEPRQYCILQQLCNLPGCHLPGTLPFPSEPSSIARCFLFHGKHVNTKGFPKREPSVRGLSHAHYQNPGLSFDALPEAKCRACFLPAQPQTLTMVFHGPYLVPSIKKCSSCYLLALVLLSFIDLHIWTIANVCQTLDDNT